MKRYAKFSYAAPFRFRVILEKPQGGGQNDPPTRAKVNQFLSLWFRCIWRKLWPKTAIFEVPTSRNLKTLDFTFDLTLT